MSTTPTPRPVDLYLLEGGRALVPTSWDTSTDDGPRGLDVMLEHVRAHVDRDEDGGALVVFGVMAQPGSVAHVRKGGALVGVLVAR